MSAAAAVFCMAAGWFGLVGLVLERGVIRHLYGRPLETLLLTWGASLIIQQALRLWDTDFLPDGWSVALVP